MKNIYYYTMILVMGGLTSGIALATITQPLNADSASGAQLIAPGGTLDNIFGLSNLQRIDDYGTVLTDQYWSLASSDGVATATARAKYAGYTHEFGIEPGAGGTTFDALFNSGSSQYGEFKNHAPEGQFSAADSGKIFRFGLNLVSQPGYRWSSAIADNRVMPGGAQGDGIDHMITFQIVGSDNKHKNTVGDYVVCWEDLHGGMAFGGFDGDYGDLIVEIAGAAPIPCTVNIPEPATLGLFALGGAIWFLRHRKT
jgi:hypothetical protein